MDDTRLVSGDQAGHDPSRDPERARQGQLGFRLQDGRKIGAVQERHRDVLDAVDLAEIVNPDDVLVGDLPGEQQLALESAFDFLRRLRVGRENLRSNHLDGHRDAQLRIPGLIHGPHAAHAELPDDVVAAPERLSHLERSAGR